MATKLLKPVVREVTDWCRKGLFGMGGRGGKSLVLTLEPGNIISFREKGMRKRYDIDIESVFNSAVRRTLEKDEIEKKKAKKLRKELGHGR